LNNIDIIRVWGLFVENIKTLTKERLA